ncbi:hypothetical protein EF902_04680 [Streptomyces sp. WAC05858]|nr:recombinase family protein [Streptomyces sp. WAC05858]RSS48682.1 hypothetical protein EF902_04680 [Streptomyces sp. WAC05858]
MGQKRRPRDPGNPRYTGHQVWNRQHKHEALLDIHDVTLGYTTAMRWNSQDKWIVSKKIVHTPLVDDDVFARVQDLFAVRSRPGTAHQRHRTRNPYLYRGRITCGICTRRMQGQWSHGDACYRCRFPEEYALANRVHHPRNIYLRESWITVPLDNWLATVFLPRRLDDTIDLMATAAVPNQEPSAAAAARAVIADCDAKLATHRAALGTGVGPALVTQWISETQARRARAEAELRTGRPTPHRVYGRTPPAASPTSPGRTPRSTRGRRWPGPGAGFRPRAGAVPGISRRAAAQRRKR